MKGQHLLNLVFILIVMVLGACNQEDPTPIVPTGDPAVAARNFINTFYSEDVRACQELFTAEVRDWARQQCQQNADRRANIDLSNAVFTVVSRRGTIAMVEMSGQWTISALNIEGQMAQDVHDTATETPLEIEMIYQDGKWLFNQFR